MASLIASPPAAAGCFSRAFLPRDFLPRCRAWIEGGPAAVCFSAIKQQSEVIRAIEQQSEVIRTISSDYSPCITDRVYVWSCRCFTPPVWLGSLHPAKASAWEACGWYSGVINMS